MMDRRRFVRILGAGTAALTGAPAAQPPRKLLLDTDIGGDIDDALALVYVLQSPELALGGVTTVMGNTRRRAQYARKVISALGRDGEIPCCAGCERGMTPAESPATGLRGYAERVRRQSIAGDGNDGELGRSDSPAISAMHAVDFLIEATRKPGGPRHILAVGAQTNVAMALLKDPGLADRLDGITLMGYNFQTGIDPYNVGWDVAATRHLLASGIPLRVLPVEIGMACQMSQAEYDACQASVCPHMELIKVSMRRWVEYVRRRPGTPIPDYLPRPYDSLTAMTLTHPGLFQWKRGTIRLETGGEPPRPKARFEERVDGLHEIVVGVDREKAMALHQKRLLACPSHPETPGRSPAAS